ncbi:hypothetical protein [uncultured Desulfuromonas sp.]|uniref:hypothetical protein n=1 Tax=uncultured Desulfuromonas sp. TaxID=181013 RepID=UPI002606F1D6|nr:hypothetical protein [uncultured Desulfuromonas sp.]
MNNRAFALHANANPSEHRGAGNPGASPVERNEGLRPGSKVVMTMVKPKTEQALELITDALEILQRSENKDIRSAVGFLQQTRQWLLKA